MRLSVLARTLLSERPGKSLTSSIYAIRTNMRKTYQIKLSNAMSRLLLSGLLLMLFSVPAFAQPADGEPAQISHALTFSDGTNTTQIYFGLDVRGSDGHDAQAGLSENEDLPPWSADLEARFLRVGDNSYTMSDIRGALADDKNLSKTHFLEFQKGLQDNSGVIEISWDFPACMQASLTDLVGGSIVDVTMTGMGSTTIPNNALGKPQVTSLQMDVVYTNIPPGLLPVELTSFTAVSSGNAAVLNWETANETNNAGFEVQQDAGNGFETIGFVAGNGTTSEATSYSYTTGALAAGSHSFRLKQVDFDGTFAYSDVVEVSVALNGAFSLTKAYPNPFNPQTQFALTIARDQQVQLEVFDMLGRRVATLFQGQLEANQAHQFSFQAGSMPSGRYYIRAMGEFFTSSQMVTLLK